MNRNITKEHKKGTDTKRALNRNIKRNAEKEHTKERGQIKGAHKKHKKGTLKRGA